MVETELFFSKDYGRNRTQSNSNVLYQISDLNYLEDSAGGPDVTVGILVKMDKVTLLEVKRSSIRVPNS